ncbi:hypothetical protein M2323_001825 [Rhodoblastus acidophilus]|nr:PGPGW domain-containing protein [Rhodoblastus acidophilus]MCW2283743.1 hypothetical protein [Rhodoblastus acidophilus]MCW2332908.1 hypothetical protein [Rhodoblastus acidophilus]
MDKTALRVWFEKLRHPERRWLRVPIGIALVFGGLVGFLPVVGFWMIPLGLSLLALDFPAAAKANRWIERKFRAAVAWAARRGLLRRRRPD